MTSTTNPFSVTIIAVIFTLFFFPAVTSQIFQPKPFSWGSFNNSQRNTVFGLINTNINFGTLQVIPESVDNVNLTNISGRVFYKDLFIFWDNKTRKIASFNTSFLVNMFCVNNATLGKGIAFVIAPNKTIPVNSYGGFLGLSNSSIDGSANNKLIVIKLDTIKQHDIDDLDDNHIGLDINDVRSNITVSLLKLGFEISPNDTKFYVIWVDYNGTSKVINVYMASQADKDHGCNNVKGDLTSWCFYLIHHSPSCSSLGLSSYWASSSSKKISLDSV